MMVKLSLSKAGIHTHTHIYMLLFLSRIRSRNWKSQRIPIKRTFFTHVQHLKAVTPLQKQGLHSKLGLSKFMGCPHFLHHFKYWSYRGSEVWNERPERPLPEFFYKRTNLVVLSLQAIPCQSAQQNNPITRANLHPKWSFLRRGNIKEQQL